MSAKARRGGESETSTVAIATVATYCFRATRHLRSTMRASLRSNASNRRTSHDRTAETASAFVVGSGDAGASASKSREASSNVSSTTGVLGDSKAAQRMTSNAASASTIGSRTCVALTSSRPAYTLVAKRSCHGVVGATGASAVLGVFDGRAGGVDGVRTAGGGVIAVVAASATRRSGVIAALPLRAGGGVLLRGLAPALLDDFCMLPQLNAATQNKSCLWACELSLSKQHC